MRRATVASKALAATTDKSLSAVTLTKKTNGLAQDLEQLKKNFDDQGREAAQKDELLHDLDARVGVLHQAFVSLSDAFTCEIEEVHKRMTQTADELRARVVKIESVVDVLQTQQARLDGKHRKLQDSAERRFSETRDGFSKLAVTMYESQSDLARVRLSTDDLLARERESAQLIQTLQSSQDEATESLMRLRQETAILQAELAALKEETTGSTVAIAADVQALSKGQSTIRALVTKQHTHWKGKLDDLRDVVDRQAKMDKTQLTQRFDALLEHFSSHETQAKAAIDAVLKNHARIREAVDEGMHICSREIKALASEVRSTCADTQERVEDLTSQIAAISVKCTRRNEDAHCGIQSIAQQLNVRV